MDSLFNKNERIGNDDSYLTQQTIQNTNYHNYTMNNYFPSKSNNHVYFASQQNGYHRGAGLGNNVQTDSELFIITERNNQNIPLLDLHQRMFLTVPYLGRGPFNVDLESTMRLGETVLKRDMADIDETTVHYIQYYDEEQENKVKKANYIVDSNEKRIGLDSKQVTN
jgi:hypothetical protein